VSGRGEHAVETAEPVQKGAGQGFYILPRDGAEQDQLQQFVVRHGHSATCQKAFAQARAVVTDIGRMLALRRRTGVVGVRKE